MLDMQQVRISVDQHVCALDLGGEFGGGDVFLAGQLTRTAGRSQCQQDHRGSGRVCGPLLRAGDLGLDVRGNHRRLTGGYAGLVDVDAGDVAEGVDVFKAPDLQLRCDLEVAVGGPRGGQVVCQIVGHRGSGTRCRPLSACPPQW